VQGDSGAKVSVFGRW